MTIADSNLGVTLFNFIDYLRLIYSFFIYPTYPISFLGLYCVLSYV
jgi:hypothetical protein